MIHKSKVLNGLAAYIDAEIVGKMTGSWKAWLLGSVVGLAVSRADAIFDTLAQNPAIKMLGIIDGENVDIDAIYAELLKQARKGSATVDVPVVGPITFGVNDVESLYRHIMGA